MAMPSLLDRYAMLADRVLVTGGEGFIGSHPVEMLNERGARVRALCFYNSFNFWGWLDDSQVKETVEVVTGDIRDLHFCERITKDIDIVYNLAALIAIPYSYAAPDSYVDTNIKGTLNICQAALKSKCKQVIHTSTSEVYGTAKYVPIDERHPLQPQSPYSATKIGADAMAMSFHNSFGLPVTIARPFNTYGPRQSARAVIPTVITQICAGKERIALGDLAPTRDFSYVEDTCGGLLALTGNERAIGEAVNIGSGTEVSIGQTVRLIKELLNSKIEIEQEEQRVRPTNSEVFRLCCDSTKLRELTGYAPKYDLRRGLEKTIRSEERRVGKECRARWWQMN